MTTSNRELAERILDAFNRADDAALDSLIAADAVDHELPEELPNGREGTKQFIAMFRAGFPDLHFELVDAVSEGDRTAMRCRCTGTHTGTFMGIPPTGRTMDMEGVDWLRIRDGVAVEHWGYNNEMEMLRQLGVIPERNAPIDLTTSTPART